MPESPLSRWMPTLLLAGLLALAYQIMAHFLAPVAWAVVLTFVTWPLYRRLQTLCGDRRVLAALTATLLLAAVILVPVLWASFALQAEIAETLSRLPLWLDQKPTLPALLLRIPHMGGELERLLGQADTVRELLLSRVLPWVRANYNALLEVLGAVGFNIGKLGFTLLTAFFLYRDGEDVLRQTRQVLCKLLGRHLDSYLAATEETLKAVVYGIVLTALAQGTLAGIGYWFVGLEAPLLLGIATFFCAMIPFATPLVWVSASAWLLVDGQAAAAAVLFLWGALAVSWVDNIVRPLVISGASSIPFLLVLFGVIGGLAHFGLIGLFLGPVVLAIGYTVWREWLAASVA